MHTALCLSALLFTLQEGEAQPEAPPPAFGGSFFLPMILIIGIFYFVLILPERKKQKRRETMLGALKKGDRVMTNGGMYASVAQVQDDVVTLQAADGVRLRYNRAAIQSVIEGEGAEAEGKAS